MNLSTLVRSSVELPKVIEKSTHPCFIAARFLFSPKLGRAELTFLKISYFELFLLGRALQIWGW